MTSGLPDQATYLSVLTHAEPESVKGFVEDLLPRVGPVDVDRNQTGLVMLPGDDTAKGEPFHLGEVLVAEAQVYIDGVPGYAACTGSDLEQALAVAILDALIQGGRLNDEISPFVREQQAAQVDADQHLREQAAATRADMETQL